MDRFIKQLYEGNKIKNKTDLKTQLLHNALLFDNILYNTLHRVFNDCLELCNFTVMTVIRYYLT